jgi:hypothetical protein
MNITKCTNKNCELKATCIRWTSDADEFQTYAQFENHNGTCDGYWDTLEENTSNINNK